MCLPVEYGMPCDLRVLEPRIDKDVEEGFPGPTRVRELQQPRRIVVQMMQPGSLEV